MRDCVHHLPKLNHARRRIRPRRWLVHLAVGVLVADEPSAESSIAEDSRGGDGHGVDEGERAREKKVSAAAVHKSNSLRQ